MAITAAALDEAKVGVSGRASKKSRDRAGTSPAAFDRCSSCLFPSSSRFLSHARHLPGRATAVFYLLSMLPPPPPPPLPLLTRHHGDHRPGRLSATSKSPSLTVSRPTRIPTCRDIARAGRLCTPALAAAYARADHCVTWCVHVAHVHRSFISAVGRACA